MTAFFMHNMAPIMFASLVVFLLLGYPVAFALAFVGLGFGVLGISLGMFNPLFLQALPDRMWGIMGNETLLAIPFFTFMGLILERSGMAEDLLDSIGQLFGPVRGGLAFAVVFVGALLAATTGVLAASVIAMGLISLPIMLRYGYDRSLATGVIAASGTLAQIIPPSLVLIVMADQLGRSVGDMYAGAIYPGLILSGLYAGYVLLRCIISPSKLPALPPEARTLGSGVLSLFAAIVISVAVGFLIERFYVGNEQWRPVAAFFGAVAFAYLMAVLNRRLKFNLLSRLAEQVIIVLIPPLALIFLVLGTIFVGVATPTEGGAMGASGALILAFGKRRLSLDVIRQALDATTKLSSFVLFILIGARTFSLTFYGVNGHVWVEHLLTSLPGGQIGFLVVVNLLVFFLAFFLDFFELAFIIIPLLAPAAAVLGIDLIWFGVLLSINMQTSFMHPPFGFALFYLRSVAATEPYVDKVTGKLMQPITTGQIYMGAIPFVLIQVIMVGITILFPSIVTHYKSTDVIDPNFKLTVPMIGNQNSGKTPGLNLGQPPKSNQPPAFNFGQPPAPNLNQPPALNFGQPPKSN